MEEPVVPSIIYHKDITLLLSALQNEEEFQCGFKGPPNHNAWYRKEVILEFPAGELARGLLISIALVGRRNYEVCNLTGSERFNAQGLEGKVRIKKELIGALFNMRDVLPPNRGRIITRYKTIIGKGGPLDGEFWNVE